MKACGDQNFGFDQFKISLCLAANKVMSSQDDENIFIFLNNHIFPLLQEEDLHEHA